MIRPLVNDGQHIQDGDIIRLLDGECVPAEERLIREHLRECAECRREADELERLSEGFGRLLRHADAVPVPSERGEAGHEEAVVTGVLTRRWTRTRVLKAAAVVALIITAVGVSPARAWFIDGWQAIRSLFSGEPAVPAEPAPPVETPNAAAIVRFTPTGPTFTIEVSSAQSNGTVSLAVDPGPSASARVLGGDGREEFVVFPGGLRIMNDPTSSASYEIVVPRSITTLELTIAGRTVLSLDETELSGLERREIDLAQQPNR
ncbi:MAG: zf-HC2 domain-containing protein [Gemmatimonadota bacterium]|nr:MAG: zf-HC2 domain-containing protein [Gemmatimonadota bacterium]